MTVPVRPSIQALPAYKPGKSVEQAAAGAEPVTAIKLSSNETPFPPLDAVRDAMVAAIDQTNRYPDNLSTALRESIAGWTGVAPEEVAVGCGSSGVLQQIFLSYIEPGDEVVYPWRSFEVYPIYTQLASGVAVNPPLVDNAFDLDSVVDAITDRTRLVLLATPNNPTGTALATADVRKFLQRVRNDVLVVLDEAYKEFMDASFDYPVSELLNDFPNVVVLRTFSKAHGLAGSRVGYALGNQAVIEAINKTFVPFSVNSAAQAGAIAAINAIDEVEARVAVIIDERRRVIEALRSTGWTVPASQGNFFFLPVGERTVEIYEVLERAGIITRPFAGEGVRITIGTADQNSRVLNALTKIEH